MEIYDLKPSLRKAGRAVAMAVLVAVAFKGPLFAAVPDGYIVKVDSAVVYLDWGSSASVKPGDVFSVYREGAVLKHPVTGEVLGHASEAVGEGSIESVDQKFSIGKLIQNSGKAKAGDRTHYKEAAPEPAASPAAPVPAGAAAGQSAVPGLTELWRAQPVKEEAVGIAIGDVDGDGQKEVVVAYKKHVDVLRWNGKDLDTVASFKSRGYSHWLAVETSNIDHAGRERIFATAFMEGFHQPRVVVIDFVDGQLKEIKHLEGFVRQISRAQGGSTLIWQGLSMSREFRVNGPFELVVDPNKGYKPGPSLNLKLLRDNQLFGFTLGDWDADGAEDLAVLQDGERLRLFFKDAKWSASDIFGSTANDFSFDEGKVASVFPRMMTWHPEHGKDWLIVPHNIPELGIRLTYFKLYRKAELYALQWNGLDMAPVWRQSLSGYLADFAAGDGLRKGSPQLWLALIGPGGKTILSAYAIPQ
jgi:hypothetical protein